MNSVTRLGLRLKLLGLRLKWRLESFWRKWGVNFTFSWHECDPLPSIGIIVMDHFAFATGNKTYTMYPAFEIYTRSIDRGLIGFTLRTGGYPFSSKWLGKSRSGWVGMRETNIYLRFWQVDEKNGGYYDFFDMRSEHLYEFVAWLVKITGKNETALWKLDVYRGSDSSIPWNANVRFLWWEDVVLL